MKVIIDWCSVAVCQTWLAEHNPIADYREMTVVNDHGMKVVDHGMKIVDHGMKVVDDHGMPVFDDPEKSIGYPELWMVDV